MKYGFPGCKKTPYIDFRLVYADDELVMRLQDNCPMFDVERYIAQEIDRAEDIRLGLKITGGLADDISYVHSIENNNVIIRFPNSKDAQNQAISGCAQYQVSR